MPFTCPDCGRTSYHPEDEANQYCGACHTFFDEASRLPEKAPKKKLPWTYYPITFIAFIFFASAGSVIGRLIGLNPYIAFALAYGALVLWEVYKLKRDGY